MADQGDEIELSDEDGAEEFYFESDYLALKSNKDYRRLLRTIFILQVQRQQAIKDIEKLETVRKQALQNPFEFVEKLTKGEDVGIPPELKLEELPDIDWSQYQDFMPESNRPFTRKKKEEVLQPKIEPGTSRSGDESSSAPRIRGKVYNEEKPESFNQLWTPGEQKRLEELLEEFPPEEVESRRWEKIATALGNRTTMQVQSRVQKYFKKLHSMGLPVPGRVPRARNNGIKKSHKHQRFNHFYIKPSTFFPELDPPVLMNDDDATSMNDSSHCNSDSNSAEDRRLTFQCGTSNQAELLALVIKDKEGRSTGHHEGFSCDGCSENPLRGTRWHCEDCASFDLCTDCMTAQLMGELKAMATTQHTETHKMRPVRTGSATNVASSSTWDPDYLAPSTSYNYLDPNFMPD